MREFLVADDGAVSLEYGLVASYVALAMLPLLTQLSTSISRLFTFDTCSVM